MSIQKLRVPQGKTINIDGIIMLLAYHMRNV